MQPHEGEEKMKTHTRLVLPLLLLAGGLWACQDQAVTPDAAGLELEAAFAKGGKPGKPGDPGTTTIPMWVGFLHPDEDPRPAYPFPNSDLDISADAQLIDVIVDEYEELQIPPTPYRLSLHFTEELPIDGYCESRECIQRSTCPVTDAFNMLQELQNASIDLGGLEGQFVEGSTDQGGIVHTTIILEDGPGYRAGEYMFATCWLNCRAREHDEDIVGDFTESWRILNAPVRVYWRTLNAKKNDQWTHRTTCGNWPAPSNRGGTYVVVGRPDGG
jgi:hypothetical protein